MQLLENADNPETDLNISDSKTKAMALQIRQEAKKATTINAASILLAKYGYKENYPPLYCLNTLTTPRSIRNCRLHVLDLGLIPRFCTICTSFLNESGLKVLNEIMHSQLLSISTSHRLRRLIEPFSSAKKKITDELSPFNDLTGGDIRQLMPYFAFMWQLCLQPAFINEHCILHFSSLTYAKAQRNIDYLNSLGLHNCSSTEEKLDCLKFCAKLLQDVYYAFLERYSSPKVESQLESVVYKLRKVSYIILEGKMKVPKNHCLRELVEEWKLFGPAIWGETSFKESKHAFFRNAIPTSNNKDAEYFCAKMEYSHQLATKKLLKVEYTQTVKSLQKI